MFNSLLGFFTCFFVVHAQVCLKNSCDVLEKLNKVEMGVGTANQDLKRLVVERTDASDANTLTEIKNLLRLMDDDNEKQHDKFEESMDELLKELKQQTEASRVRDDVQSNHDQILSKIDEVDENMEKFETVAKLMVQKMSHDLLITMDEHVDEMKEEFGKKIDSLETSILRLTAMIEDGMVEPAPDSEFSNSLPPTDAPETDDDSESTVDRLATMLKITTPKPTPTSRPKIEDCSEVPTTNGLFTLRSGLAVKCLNGWTSLLDVTVSDKLSLNRPWAEYLSGFENFKGGYWFGLQKLAALVNNGKKWQLKFTVEANKIKSINSNEWIDIEPVIISGFYDQFQISNSKNEDYRVSLGNYHGNPKFNAFNCLGKGLSSRINNYKFSTFDHANDGSKSGNTCARNNKAGFWWNMCALLELEDFSFGRVGRLETCESMNSKIYSLASYALDIRPMN